ncbi:MAG TPA: hypothetical protein VHU40_00245 [Polyangia bacterium]|jgi:hypothetical protein|nr:hypothetical protein [Polyangia bacterium]
MNEVPPRQLTQQHMLAIRRAFAVPLAARLGRSAAEISEEGLTAGDFELDRRVELTLGDGSTMSLRHAFAVVDVQQHLVGIFTEHCGYFCYATVDLELTEFKGDTVAARHVW